jgi:ATP-dependent Clp protease ATP-binding subunit ClpA
MGFGRGAREGDDTEAINRMFTPEFRNRLDATISFKALPIEVIDRVVDKFIAELEGQLAERAVSIELSGPARKWLGKKGYSLEYGARPLTRVIQEHIKKPLAEELLFGKLANGGAVEVVVQKGGKALSFKFPGSEKKPTKKPSPKRARKPKAPAKVK